MDFKNPFANLLTTVGNPRHTVTAAQTTAQKAKQLPAQASSIVAGGGAFGGGGSSGSWDPVQQVTQVASTATQQVLGSVQSGPVNGESADTSKTGEGAGIGYKVRLFAVRDFPSDYVIFEVSPTLSESRTVDYQGVNPVHMPGSIQVYKRSNSRTFSIGAKLVSRNQSQADANIKTLQKLRGWTMPYFGIGDHTDGADTTSMLGAPPDVLYLYAYSNDHQSEDGTRGKVEDGAMNVNLKKIPVVITSMSLDYPEDVDYIPTSSGEPFPIKMEVKIDLAETHSPVGYEKFSLAAFKLGRLVQF